MSMSMSAIKVLAAFFNVILACCAIIVLGWITYTSVAIRPWDTTTVCVVSSFVIIFAILGIVAVKRESIWLAVLCVCFLCILITLQVLGAYMLQNDENDESSHRSVVEKAWIANDMHDLEENYACCGKVSPQDYVHLNQPIPASCFDDALQDAEHLHLQGCLQKLISYYEEQHLVYVICAWVLVGVEAICCLMMLLLIINIRNERRRMEF